jgi:peptide/nickel transport system permease protein
MTLSAGEHGYAVAVRQLGASPLRVYGRHILPNISSALIVNVTLYFPEHIILETGLSYQSWTRFLRPVGKFVAGS